MNKPCRKFYKELRTLTPSRGRYERKMLRTYKMRLQSLSSRDDCATYDKLVGELGNPRDIVDDYYANIDPVYLIKKMNIVRTVRRFLCYVLVLFMVSTSTIGFFAVKYYIKKNTPIPVFKFDLSVSEDDEND